MRKLSVVVVVGLVLVTAWYFASPGYAMMQLKDAAIDGDAKALEERIDFARVRESLKSEVKAQMATELTKSDGKGFEAIGAAFAMAMIDPMIEGFVTPDGMAALIRRGKMKAPNQAKSETGDVQTDWTIERDGISEFRATPDGKDGEPVPSLVFERDGLSWKLTQIDIPEGGFGKSSKN